MSKLENEIKQNVLDFISDLKDNVFCENDEQGEFMLVEFFFTKMHAGRVTQHIIDHVLPHKLIIKKRNLHFFIENRKIFSGLPEDRIDYYGEILGGGKVVDKENMEYIWEYFDIMIKLTEKYKKDK